jgi:hypothetical protein
VAISGGVWVAIGDGAPIDFGALRTGHLPLDIDTFVIDQSDTAKEGVCPPKMKWTLSSQARQSSTR